jgi:hypothetical protein
MCCDKINTNLIFSLSCSLGNHAKFSFLFIAMLAVYKILKYDFSFPVLQIQIRSDPDVWDRIRILALIKVNELDKTNFVQKLFS